MSGSDSPWSKVAGVVLVQVVLVAVAYGGLRWTGIDVILDRDGAGLNVLMGVLAGCASYLVLLVVVRTDMPLAREFRNVAGKVREGVSDFNITAIVIVALAASIGEELFFRVFLQSWMTSLTSPFPGIAIASVAFALGHASSVSYFVLSLLLGLAIGAAYGVTGSLILVFCWHFVYDLMALWIIIKRPELLRLRGNTEATDKKA